MATPHTCDFSQSAYNIPPAPQFSPTTLRSFPFSDIITNLIITLTPQIPFSRASSRIHNSQAVSPLLQLMCLHLSSDSRMVSCPSLSATRPHLPFSQNTKKKFGLMCIVPSSSFKEKRSKKTDGEKEREKLQPGIQGKIKSVLSSSHSSLFIFRQPSIYSSIRISIMPLDRHLTYTPPNFERNLLN